jgi:hypothetical protein
VIVDLPTCLAAGFRFSSRSDEIQHTTVEEFFRVGHPRGPDCAVWPEIAMHECHSLHPIELCDHLTTRPGGLRGEWTRSILYHYFSQHPGLDASGEATNVESLADIMIRFPLPRRNNQWLTPWP